MLIQHLTLLCAILASARNKDQELVGRFSENGYFWVTYSCIAVPIENVQQILVTKMDFGRPNTEIGQKMANGRLPMADCYF